MNHPSKTLPFFSLVFNLALLVSSKLGFILLSLLVQLPELCQCCFSTEFFTETFPFSFFCLLCYLLELLGLGIHCRCECWVWVWMDARHPDSRKEAWQILLIWSYMERVWSILTLMYFTEVLKGMLLPPVLTESLSTSLRQDQVPTANASVLSVFIMSLLLFIHDKMSLTHA